MKISSGNFDIYRKFWVQVLCLLLFTYGPFSFELCCFPYNVFFGSIMAVSFELWCSPINFVKNREGLVLHNGRHRAHASQLGTPTGRERCRRLRAVGVVPVSGPPATLQRSARLSQPRSPLTDTSATFGRGECSISATSGLRLCLLGCLC